jgi:hypothetical protein
VNLVYGLISLPEKSESFQGLLLDLHLICTKYLVISLNVIVPASLQVSVSLFSSDFLVMPVM